MEAPALLPHGFSRGSAYARSRPLPPLGLDAGALPSGGSQPAPPERTRIAPSPPRRTILVLEDDPFDVDMFANTLAALGVTHPLVNCEQGAEGIAWLRAGLEPPAQGDHVAGIVFVDLQLPQIDGCAVIGWIRRQPGLANLPVVAVTGSDDHALGLRALSAGADDLLSKPASPAALRSILAEYGLLGVEVLPPRNGAWARRS